MRRFSAGILTFRRRGQGLEVFLVHPGGPFWQKKDIGAWSIPKGEYLNGEDELATAKREFEEETGVRPEGEFVPLDSVTQPSGKVVTAWALEGDCSTTIRSNTFSMEWPPNPAKGESFPSGSRELVSPSRSSGPYPQGTDRVSGTTHGSLPARGSTEVRTHGVSQDFNLRRVTP